MSLELYYLIFTKNQNTIKQKNYEKLLFFYEKGIIQSISYWLMKDKNDKIITSGERGEDREDNPINYCLNSTNQEKYFLFFSTL